MIYIELTYICIYRICVLDVTILSSGWPPLGKESPLISPALPSLNLPIGWLVLHVTVHSK